MLLSLALLGMMGAAFFASLEMTSSVTISADERDTAKNLAETQMEYVKNQGFKADASYAYSPVLSEYDSYILDMNVQPLYDQDIQAIQITVDHVGKTLARLEAYKVRQ